MFLVKQSGDRWGASVFRSILYRRQLNAQPLFTR